MREGFLDSLISKLDSLDSNNMQAFILHLVKDKGFLETIFNTIKEGIVVIDRYLNIQYTNKSAADMLGIPDNIREQKISKFLRDIDWKRILQEDEDEWYRISRQDVKVSYPRRRILNFYIVPHGDDQELATIILNDITESKLSALENFESEKSALISMLAASVAHEIGNPLNSLNIHLQLLERHSRGTDEKPADDEALDMIDVAKSEVKRLDLIITQFLTAIRPTKPSMERLDLKELVEATLNFMKNEIEDRSIAVYCEWPEVMPDISGDSNQLKQAVYNLIKNASQAMPEGGRIDIVCIVDEDNLRMSISDSGCGISAKDMGNIFEPYFTRKQTGTGLGLMIVERIVREHGAELAVESEPGKGTVFIINFPLYSQRVKLLPSSE
jgi:two-component system, sporulation sensor kinase E